jgi:dihydropteroate synthase-like protein
VSREHLQFVTGRLAEHALRDAVASLAAKLDFDYTISVLPITVAALMTPEWIAKKLEVDPKATRIILPGYCEGNAAPIIALAGERSVEFGPRDLRRLPEHFGQQRDLTGYGEHDIQILAEINNCPRLSLDEILVIAKRYAANGADLIDIGCDPGGPWLGVADAVRAVRDLGLRVSIDSLDPREIAPAVAAGAELVLSVNSSNREAALDWGAEVVAVPDDPKTLSGLDETIEYLATRGVPLRIDPILEPIGFGFAASLERYMTTRRRYPDAEMMMGIGNLTELTDVDSAGVNVMLLAICQELGIRSVLTTEVINWARSSVRECDLGRQLVHHAIHHGVLPKHLDTRLVTLRDPKVTEPTTEDLDRLAAEIKDNNYRVFSSEGEVHLVSHALHLADRDPFALIDRLLNSGPSGGAPANLDASHAFYLGYEMCKALNAIVLDKQYQQDEPLDWGHLTRDEVRHYLKAKRPTRE